MKTSKILLSGIFLMLAFVSFAQAPQEFKYQTLVRNSAGDVIQNQNVSLRFSIRDGSISGTILFQETHSVQTNAFGLVNVEIGNGVLVSGSMSNVDWGSDIKFLQTELDVAGGSSYVNMGTSEMVSVPYALYAESTGDHVWSKNGSNVFYNTGNVGIGTDTPGAKLDVYGHIWQRGTGNSIFLGEGAGKYDDLSNNNNTYIGYNAGYWNSTGSNNVAIGYVAGQGNYTGSNNIVIGANASAGSSGSSDFMNIGNTLYGDLSNRRIGIGTQSPIVDLDIRNNTGYAIISLQSNSGSSLLKLDRENSTNAAYINFSTNATDQWAVGTIGNNGFAISKAWSAPDGTVYISTNGNLGIGTINPGAKLEVAGHIWQSGTGYSVFIGKNAGANDDLSDNYNTYVGYNAGQNNSTAYNNSAFGSHALNANTSGNQNTAIGGFALASNVGGSQNTGVGYSTLSNNTSGGSNAALGYGALLSNEDGGSNTASGFYSLHDNISGSYNTAQGYYSLYNNETGSGNTALGYYTLMNSTGHYNIAIGNSAGYSLTSGSNNIFIGCDAPNPTGSNQMFLGGILYGNISNGNIGIGTTSPGAKLDVTGHIWQTGTGQSVFIGEFAGANDDLSNNWNTFVGYSAGVTNSSGTLNSAFGHASLFSNQDGNYNSAFGVHALEYNSSGENNCGFGYLSLYYNETGNNNTAIGNKALQYTTGSNNIAIGYSAGDNITIGTNNIIIGSDLNAPVSNGSNQMYLGGILYGNLSNGRIGIGTTSPSAGLHIKGSGFPNSFLYIEGAVNQDAGIRLYEGTIDKWHIFNNETSNGLQIYNTAGTTVFFAQQSSGNVGIGTTSPEHTLHVNGSELLASGPTGGFKFRDRASNTAIDDWVWYSLNDYGYFYKSGLGNIWTIANDGKLGIRRTPTANMLEVNGNASKTTAGDWLANSDRRIKTDIHDIDNASQILMRLHPIKFKYTQEWKDKHPEIEDHYYYNFIAQEYQRVFPEAVKRSGEYIGADKNEILQIDSYNAQIVTIAAVQELILENNKKDELIQGQQKLLENLQMEVENLKMMIGEMSK